MGYRGLFEQSLNDRILARRKYFGTQLKSDQKKLRVPQKAHQIEKSIEIKIGINFSKQLR